MSDWEGIFTARLTDRDDSGAAPVYDFVEVVPDPNDPDEWLDVAGGRRGVGTARELNGRTIDTPVVTWLRFRTLAGGDAVFEFNADRALPTSNLYSTIAKIVEWSEANQWYVAHESYYDEGDGLWHEDDTSVFKVKEPNGYELNVGKRYAITLVPPAEGNTHTYHAVHSIPCGELTAGVISTEDGQVIPGAKLLHGSLVVRDNGADPGDIVFSLASDPTRTYRFRWTPTETGGTFQHIVDGDTAVFTMTYDHDGVHDRPALTSVRYGVAGDSHFLYEQTTTHAQVYLPLYLEGVLVSYFRIWQTATAGDCKYVNVEDEQDVGFRYSSSEEHPVFFLNGQDGVSGTNELGTVVGGIVTSVATDPAGFDGTVP